MTILDQLAVHAGERVSEAKRNIPLEVVKERALALPKGGFEFEQALKKRIFPLFVNVKRHHHPKA